MLFHVVTIINSKFVLEKWPGRCKAPDTGVVSINSDKTQGSKHVYVGISGRLE